MYDDRLTPSSAPQHPSRPERRGRRRSSLAVALASLVLLTGPVACDGGPSLEDVRAQQARGQFADTVEPLRVMLETSPNDPEINYLYGIALNRTMRSPIAVWALRKAAEDPAWGARARLELATLSIRNGDFADAIEYANATIEAEPDSIAALSLRGMAYLEQDEEPERALEDFDRVLSIDPNDEASLASRAAVLLVLGRVDEAAAAIDEIEARATEGGESGSTRAMVCATRSVLAAERNDLEAAEKSFDTCLEAHPLDATLIEQAVAFFDQTERSERATQILEGALETSPGIWVYRASLSARLAVKGDLEAAAAILVEGTTLPDQRTRIAAWTALTNFYLEQDDLSSAIESYREALALTPAPSQLAILTLADLLARAERHAEALEVVGRIERDSYRGLVEARIHLNEGRPARALARLDDVFPSWPNNPGARYYAARAAEQLGDFARAVEEYRQSIRSGPEQTEAALRLAHLYLAAGSLQNAWNSAAQYFRGHRDDPEAIRVLLRAASGAETGSVSELLSRLRNEPLWPTALAMRAERIESIRGAEAALELLEGTDALDLTQPANAEVLRVKARLLLSSGRADAALIATRAALDAAPEAGPFHEIHATVLAATKADPTRVRAAFERAVELSPEDWISLESLGRNREEAGDLEEALSLYRRAAAAAPDQASPGRAIANTLAGMGRTAESEAAWEAQLREQPWDAEAAIALVSQRIAAGRLDDRTVELAERAVLFLGGAEAEQQLIEVHRARGETDRAQALEHAMAERTPLAPTRITPVDTL